MFHQWSEDDYCAYVGADGNHCRALKIPTRDVCIAHWKHDGQFVQDPAAAAELAGLALAMRTSRGINRFLSALARLTSEDRVSYRKATLLAYQAQLALYALGRPPRQHRTEPPTEAFDSSEPSLPAGRPNGSPHGPNGSSATASESAHDE